MNGRKSLPQQSWEQQPGETDLAFNFFMSYLQLGPDRSMTKVLQKHNKKPSYKNQLGKWSVKNNWVERCSEYDTHLIYKSLENKEMIINKAKGRLLMKVDRMLDELFDIAEADTVLFLGELSTSVVAQKLKAIEIVLDRAGIVSPKQELDTDKPVNINTYIQQIYNRIEGK